MSKNKLQVYSRLRINAVFQLFLFLFWLPRNIRSSQAKDQIRAAVATYTAAAATHCAGLGMEPTSWRWRDAADPIASQQELPCYCLLTGSFLRLLSFRWVFGSSTDSLHCCSSLHPAKSFHLLMLDCLLQKKRIRLVYFFTFQTTEILLFRC